MKRINAQNLLSSAVFFFSLSVILFARAQWWAALDWQGEAKFTQRFAEEHQVIAACRQGRIDILHYWVRMEGFNPNQKFFGGECGDPVSCLWVASYEGHADIVDYLIQIGANVDLTCMGGISPINIAVFNYHAEVVDRLLLAGADLNQQTGLGKTPLYKASACGDFEAVRRFLEAGADPTLKMSLTTHIKFSPVYVAKINRFFRGNHEPYRNYDKVIGFLTSAERRVRPSNTHRFMVDDNLEASMPVQKPLFSVGRKTSQH